MSFQDLQRLIWEGDAICPECGDQLDGENVSVEGFEREGQLICTDCAETFADDEEDEDE